MLMMIKAGLLLSLCLVASCASATSTKPPPDQQRVPEATQSESRKFQRLGDVPPGRGWYHVQFVSDDAGWLHDGSNLWRTTSGGTHWEIVSAGDPNTLYEISASHFLSAQLGFVIKSGQVYKTDNGGRTWTVLPIAPLQSPGGALQDVSFLPGGGIGWAVGGIFRPKTALELAGGVPAKLSSTDGKSIITEAIYRTDDGGGTWQRQPAPTQIGMVRSLYFINNEKAFALGNSVLHTQNGGHTWKPIRFQARCSDGASEQRDALSVSFVDANTGWLSYNDGSLVNTSDGGHTWCDLASPDEIWPEDYHAAYFEKIYFTSRTRGLALGGDKLLYATEDGGRKWSLLDANQRFDDLFLLPAGKAWAVSKDGLFKINPAS